MKKGLVGVLRALGVLLGIWAVLAVVGLVAGVVPLPGSLPEPRASDVDAAPEAEDSTADADAGPAAVARAGDAGDGDAGSSAGETGTDAADGVQTVARWTVCDSAVLRPSLAAVQVIGSPSPELAVGCDGVVHLLAVVEGRPVRVATFDAERSEDPALAIHAAAPVAGDVDGDSRPDLLLPFWHSSRDGSARGGKLFLVRGDATGAFEEPRLLGPIAAVSVALAQLDGRPGLDVIAMNRGSALARRPSEAWIYTGGAAPVRSAVLRSGLGGNAVAVADLDRDTHLDVVAAVSGDPRVDVFFGDGTGRFPRSSTVTVPDASEALAVDLDGDGGTDVVVRGQGVHLLRAGPAESVQPQPVDVPADLVQVTAADVNGDERVDLVGLEEGSLAVMPRQDDLTFASPVLRRPTPVVMHRLVVADLDGNGEMDAAALGRPGSDDTPWELVLLPPLSDDSPLHGTDQAEALPDAPLVLRVPLD